MIFAPRGLRIFSRQSLKARVLHFDRGSEVLSKRVTGEVQLRLPAISQFVKGVINSNCHWTPLLEAFESYTLGKVDEAGGLDRVQGTSKIDEAE